MAAVCVFCSSSERIDSTFLTLASDVGTEIARRGHTLVSGGGRVSCMGAVARAARAGGARTVGVMPAALVDKEIADDDADELVVTGDMRTRKHEMERRADAFLALPGGLGTLEELFEIWVGHTLGLHTKPVVVLDPSGFYAPLRGQVDRLCAEGFLRPAALDSLAWTATPAEALDAVESGLSAPVRDVPEPEEILEAEP
ncbi:MAG: TIGR00730 family Rossman fold protein [Actinomycetes bacterium]